MNRETVTSKKVVQLLAPAAVTATGTSAYIDLQGFDAVDIIVPHGATTADAGSHNLLLELQEKDSAPQTAAGYTDVAAADLVGEFALLENAVAAGVQVVGYRGTKRYLRVLMTETGTHSTVLGVLAVLTLADRDPANAKTVTTGAVS